MLVHQRHGPIQWIDEEISTNLFRRLVGARIFLTNAGVEEAFDVTTVHLESTRGESAKRRQQLQEIFEILRVRNAPHALLCGDFNFDPSEEEEREIDPAVWTDAWTSAGDGRCEGYTEDTSVNIMRAMHSHTTKQVRYDRVILKSESVTFQKGETHVMGRQCIDEGRQTWPSDHFGVQCTLVKNKE